MSELDESELEITTCKGDCSKVGSAEIGVKIRHIPTGTIAYSLSKKSQYANKVAAIEKIKIKLKLN